MTQEQMLAYAKYLQGQGPMPGAAPAQQLPTLQNSLFGGSQMPASPQVQAPPQTFDHAAQMKLPMEAASPEQLHEMRLMAQQTVSKLQGGAGGAGGTAGGALEPMAPALAGPSDPTQGTGGAPLGNVDPDMLRRIGMQMYSSGAGEDRVGAGGMLGAAKSATQGAVDEAAGVQAGLDATAAKANANQPVLDEQVMLAKRQEDEQREIVRKGEEAADKQMQRVMLAADAASQASVHSFWADKSTGARIMGILAQALSGAANGLANNPGAATPLDRIIARDMELQTQNLAQKNRTVDNERSVLRDIHTDTGDKLAANAAMYIAAWKRVETTVLDLGNKWATPLAEAKKKEIAGLAQQKIAAATQQLYTNLRTQGIDKEMAGAKLLQDDQAMSAPHVGKAEDAQIYKIAGTTKPVDKRTYEVFKDEDQNYKGIMAQQEKIRYIMRHADTLGQAEAFRQYKAARSDLFAIIRKQQGTGAAMSDQELKNAEQEMPDYASASAPGWRDLVASGGVQQLDRLMSNTSRHFFGHINGTIEGVQLDPNDKLYGRHVQNYMRELSAQQADFAPQPGAQ